MNKIWSYLYKLYVLLTAFLVCLLIFMSKNYTVFGTTMKQYLICTALCVAGLFIGSLVFTVLHEIGHVLAIKTAKATLIECSFLGFLRYYDGEKYLTRFRLKSAYQGYVSFVSKDYGKLDKIYYKSIRFALLGSILSVVIFLLLFLLWRNFYVYSLCGGALIASLYFTLINFLSFMPTSDGAELFSAKKNGSKLRCGLEIQSRLFYGESVSQMDSDLFLSENAGEYSEYYSYLRLLQNGYDEQAFNYLEEIEKKYKERHQQLSVEFEIELFYRSILKGDNESVEKNQDIMVALCEDNPSPLTLRVMIAYRTFKGDDEWASVLKQRLDNTDTFKLIGLLKTEKQIVDNFINHTSKNGNDG